MGKTKVRRIEVERAGERNREGREREIEWVKEISCNLLMVRREEADSPLS